jgi:DNA ligase 1
MTLLANLAATSQRVSATSARLTKVRELAAFLKTLQGPEIDLAVHYLSGEIPQGKIGIGYSVLKGAAGNAASAASISLSELDHTLTQLASIKGSGSTAKRAQALSDLFSRATAEEQSFLLHLLVGELRQGALAGVMVDAIAAASEVPVAQVRRAVMYSKSLGLVASTALLEGAQALDRFQLEMFAPILPMLAQTAADVDEALTELNHPSPPPRAASNPAESQHPPVADDDRAASPKSALYPPGAVDFQWKLDGARIQVHKSANEVRIYTRSLNDITAAIPEIAEAVSVFSEQTLVLDGEAIAFDAKGRPRPFQITMRRFGRKLNVEAARVELPIQAFFFDCLRIGDQSIADRPTAERLAALEKSVPNSMLVPRLVTASRQAAREFYDAALAAGHEGVMAKSLDAPYEAGNRGASWLKIKRAHTLDLVVLAAEWGHGRRTGKLSNLHLGALDPATGEYVMLGKTFKGLTDALLEWQTKEFLAREVRRDQWAVYVRPELVVEIAFSDLQASTRYPGGLALRLARVKRYRDDKRLEEADNMDAVRKIFAAQGGAAESDDGGTDASDTEQT